MPRATLVAAALAVSILGPAAAAQNFAPVEPPFRVESAVRLQGARGVEGYVYNDGLLRLSNVRLRVEVLDTEGRAIKEVFGWVVGDLAPRDRAYFIVAVTALGTRVPGERELEWRALTALRLKSLIRCLRDVRSS